MKPKSIGTLDDLYAQMRAGTISKRQLEDEIYRFFLNDNYFGEHLQKNTAQFCDFLCSIYPKISKAIDRYTDTGSSFQAYIATIIFYSLKEEKFKERRRTFFDDLCFQESRREMLVAEAGNGYEAVPCIGSGRGTHTLNRHVLRTLRGMPGRGKAWVKLIIIMLKSYAIIEPYHIEMVAKLTGIDYEKLYRLIDTVKAKRFEADTDLMQLKDRVHTQYCRCLAYETRLKKIAKGDYQYGRLVEKLNRAKETLKNMRFRLKHKRVDATNKQVAEVLGIPKGSVDFCISSIRHKL